MSQEKQEQLFTYIKNYKLVSFLINSKQNANIISDLDISYSIINKQYKPISKLSVSLQQIYNLLNPYYSQNNQKQLYDIVSQLQIFVDKQQEIYSTQILRNLLQMIQKVDYTLYFQLINKQTNIFIKNQQQKQQLIDNDQFFYLYKQFDNYFTQQERQFIRLGSSILNYLVNIRKPDLYTDVSLTILKEFAKVLKKDDEQSLFFSQQDIQLLDNFHNVKLSYIKREYQHNFIYNILIQILKLSRTENKIRKLMEQIQAHLQFDYLLDIVIIKTLCQQNRSQQQMNEIIKIIQKQIPQDKEQIKQLAFLLKLLNVNSFQVYSQNLDIAIDINNIYGDNFKSMQYLQKHNINNDLLYRCQNYIIQDKQFEQNNIITLHSNIQLQNINNINVYTNLTFDKHILNFVTLQSKLSSISNYTLLFQNINEQMQQLNEEEQINILQVILTQLYINKNIIINNQVIEQIIYFLESILSNVKTNIEAKTSLILQCYLVIIQNLDNQLLNIKQSLIIQSFITFDKTKSQKFLINYGSFSILMQQSTNLFQQIVHIKQETLQQQFSLQEIIRCILEKLSYIPYHLCSFLRGNGYYQKTDTIGDNFQIQHNKYLSQIISKVLKDIYSQNNATINKNLQEYIQYDINLTNVFKYFVNLLNKNISSLVKQKCEAGIPIKEFYLPTIDFLYNSIKDFNQKMNYQDFIKKYKVQTLYLKKIYSSRDKPLLIQGDQDKYFILKNDIDTDASIQQFIYNVQKQESNLDLVSYNVQLIYGDRTSFMEFINNQQPLDKFLRVNYYQPRKQFDQLQGSQTSLSYQIYNKSYDYIRNQLIANQNIINTVQRKNFTFSYAQQTVLCYLFLLHDRHKGNTLIQNQTNIAITIDLESCFGYGLQLPYSEIVNQRFSPLITSIIDNDCIYYEYRYLCHKYLDIMLKYIQDYIRYSENIKTYYLQGTQYNKTIDKIKIIQYMRQNLLNTDQYHQIFDIYLQHQFDYYSLSQMYHGWASFDLDNNYIDINYGKLKGPQNVQFLKQK